MSKLGMSNGNLYEIVPSKSDPSRALVFLSADDPALMTMALNRILSGENDTYRDIRTVEFIPSQELTGSGKNPQSVGYLYTGVLLIRDSMIIPDVTEDDFVVKVGVPPRTTKRMIDRFCERTGIDPKNVYISQSTAHASVALRPETVEDFNRQAASHFAGGTTIDLSGKYGSHRYPAGSFVLPIYAMFFTVLLPIDREVPLSKLKRFIRTVKLPFLHSDADSCDATDASILADQSLLDESLASMAFVNDALLSREELEQRYELEQARYRQAEFRYLDADKQFPCLEDEQDRYEEIRDSYLDSGGKDDFVDFAPSDDEDEEAAAPAKKCIALCAPQPGVFYTEGISGLTDEQLHEIGFAISSNADITSETTEVWVTEYNRHIVIGNTIVRKTGSDAYSYRLMGFNHYDLANSLSYGERTATGKAGLLFQMFYCIGNLCKAAKGNGANIGWNNSDLRKVCNEKLFPSLRKETQRCVKPVRVPTAASTTSSAVVETTETMFLPSEAEVFGRAVKMRVVEGKQYAWYAAHNADQSRVKAVQGCSNWWWLRSPLDFDPVSKRPEFCCVSSDGAASAKPVDRRGGVSPCFCI